MARVIPHLNLKHYTEGGAEQRRTFVKTLGDGLRHCGFLTVEGHNLKPEVIEAVYQGFKDFFALPEDVKNQYAGSAGGARGYSPFGKEHAKHTTVADLKEFWHTGQDLPEGHPYRNTYPDNIWPKEIPGLKENVLELYRELETCARVILIGLAEYFELPEQTFAAMLKDGDSVLRNLHYPPIPADADPRAVRAAAHEDINLITLLIESHGQGLELLSEKGEWVAVDALKGDIVVDSGDMLSRITNGVIPSTTHRVVNPQDGKNTSRYSMPFFAHPYSTCDLTVLDRFTGPGNPAKFPPTTAGAYLRERLNEIGLLET